MDFVYSIILGIVEGLTEFLPISSTGHLLVASALMGFPPASYRLAFDIFIQLGAVIAVIVFYFRDLLAQARKIPTDKGTQRFWLNILVAFLPAAVIGLLVKSRLDALMDQSGRLPSLIVAAALIVGGIVFLVLERQERPAQQPALEQITLRQAFIVGMAQVVSLIPGVSRSGATIVGGILSGLDRLTATAFSFYLFIPTLGAATLYSLYSALKNHDIEADKLPLFLVGTAVSFVVAYASIAWLLRYVATHTFRAFGIYRIIAGIVIIILALGNVLSH
jgi:undecaprenyl-diphosphatase